MDKITLKFHDKERELDLNTDEGKAKIKELAEKGYAYEEGQTKLKTVEEEKQQLQTAIDTWNAQLTAAKEDPKAAEKLRVQLESEGIKLTESKKDDTEYIDEKAKEKIEQLEGQINEISKQNVEMRGFVLNQVYDTQHAELENAYTKDKGYPEYVRKDVQEYADKHGIVSFKTAYLEMNEEDIVKSRVEFEKGKKTKQTEKIKKVASEEVDDTELPPEKKQVFNKYGEASRKAQQEIDQGIKEPLYIGK